MSSKVKITLSLEEGLVKELEEIGRVKRTPRSRLVEEALRFWRRSLLEQQLKDGYQSMAIEDRATAERNLAAGWEIVK
jgi:metal-responsive CopG/Arc/MetJ family transcriptional regulator